MRPRSTEWRGYAAACAGLVAATTGSVTAVEFVERALPFDIEHRMVAGFDRIGDSEHGYDWAQSGVALGDIDGDGDVDIVAAGGVLTNHVLLNDGGRFVDITKDSGIEVGEFDRVPTLGDVDGDGDLDLWLGSLTGGEGATDGYSRLYRNDGKGHFEDVSVLGATFGAGHSIHAKWFDLDLDGALDLYVSEFHGTRNRLYRNNGDGTFTEIGAQSGADAPGSTHVTGIVDTNRDGVYELFVGNDWLISEALGLENNSGDLLYQGNLDGTFTDITQDSGNGHLRAIMGMAFGDVDYDGSLDVYKADGGRNHLLLNRGWPESGVPWSLAEENFGIDMPEVVDHRDPLVVGPSVSWGTVFFDADLDGWLDLYVANGHVLGFELLANGHVREQQNFFFRGLGPEATFVFEDATEVAGLLDYHDDRGVAVADIGEDGDLDIFVTPTSGRIRFYENLSAGNGNGWIGVRPICRTSAPSCAGTQVGRRDALGIDHLRVLATDASTASQSDESTAYFGLADELDTTVWVEFPSGIRLNAYAVQSGSIGVPVEPKIFELPTRKVAPSSATDPRPYTVTVLAYDRHGEPLGSDAEVAIAIDGWQAAGGVEHIVDNRFERTFYIPSVEGRYRVRASFDDFLVRIQPAIHVLGAFDPDASHVMVTPEAVRAGGDDSFRVWVAPKDRFGASIGAGRSVSVTINGVAQNAPLADHGDGRYSIDLPAPTEPGMFAVDCMIDGLEVFGQDNIVVETAGLPDPLATGFYLEQPQKLHSAAPTMAKVLVTPRDSATRRLGPGADVELEIVPDPDSPLVTIRTDTYSGGRTDGSFAFVLEKHMDGLDRQASGSVVLTIDGIAMGTYPYTF